MTGDSPQETFLTVSEIAERLRVNPQTVRNWIARGQLHAIRVGQRRIRVRQSDFDRFIGLGTSTATPTRHGQEPRTTDTPLGIRPATESDPRGWFLGAGLDVLIAAVRERPAELASALRTLARHAELWAATQGG